MLDDLREIEEVNLNEECIMGLNERLGELENRIAISGEITNGELT